MKRFFYVALTSAIALLPCISARSQDGAVAKPPKKLNLIHDKEPLDAGMKARTSFAPMIKRVAPSVVTIQAERVPKGKGGPLLFDDPTFKKFFEGRPSPPRGVIPSLGSGVIITSDGYILTNNHVIKDASRIKVVLHTKKRYSAELIGTDPKTDVALLKIDVKTALPAISIGDSSGIEVGDMAFAFGNPFGVGQTVTRGMISALGRGNLGITSYDNFIQTDAAINKGNSGGALVDAKGRLIGINTAIVSSSGGSQGIGLAIPINQAISVMERIVMHGKVIRGFLGIKVRAIRAEDVKFYELKDRNGALVTHVVKESVAEKAGIKKGDIVIQMGGARLKDDQQLRRMIASSKPNTEIAVRLIREGKGVEVKVHLSEQPDVNLASKSAGGLMKNLLRGVTVVDLTPKMRARIRAPRDLNGVVISDVDPEAPAARAGLKTGDLVMEINRKKIVNAATAIELAGKLKGRSVLLYVWSQGAARFVVVKR